jgi:hypothetical protein
MYKYLVPHMEAGILLFVEARLDSIAAGIAAVYGIAEAIVLRVMCRLALWADKHKPGSAG